MLMWASSLRLVDSVTVFTKTKIKILLSTITVNNTDYFTTVVLNVYKMILLVIKNVDSNCLFTIVITKL